MKGEIVLQAVLWTIVSCANFNITNLSNCRDVPLNYKNDAEVEVKDVTYEATGGFFDVIHGKFLVHLRRDHKDTEVVIAFFKCPKGAEGLCETKVKEVTEDLDCARFHSDKTGPWAMFAPAIDKRNPCAEHQGEFDITYAKLEAGHLEKYIAIEEGHYRVKTIHHLPGENFEDKNLRGCIELDFDIFA